jgi:hypothetical protein
VFSTNIQRPTDQNGISNCSMENNTIHDKNSLDADFSCLVLRADPFFALFNNRAVQILRTGQSVALFHLRAALFTRCSIHALVHLRTVPFTRRFIHALFHLRAGSLTRRFIFALANLRAGLSTRTGQFMP